MAEIEEIFSTIGFFVISIIIGAIIIIGYLNLENKSYSENLNYIRAEINNENLNSFLILTEPYTDKSVLSLLGNLLYKEENLTPYNIEININNTIRKKLDLYFGEGNYFVNLTPRNKNLTLHVLYDDGELLEAIDTTENFALILNNLLTYNEEINLKIKVTILSRDSTSDRCEPFNTGDSEITCEIKNINTLYNPTHVLFTDPMINTYGNLPDIDRYQIKDYATLIGRVLEPLEDTNDNKNVIIVFSDTATLGRFSLEYYQTSLTFGAVTTGCNICNWRSQFKRVCDDAWTSANCVSSDPSCTSNYNNCIDIQTPLYQNCITSRNDCIRNNNKIKNGELDYKYLCLEYDLEEVSNSTIERLTPLIENKEIPIYPVIFWDNNFVYPEDFEDSITLYLNSNGIPIGNNLFPDSDPGTICSKTACPACIETGGERILQNKSRITQLKQTEYLAQISDSFVTKYDSSTGLSPIMEEIIESEIFERIEIGEKRVTPNKNVLIEDFVINLKDGTSTFTLELEVYQDLTGKINKFTPKPILINKSSSGKTVLNIASIEQIENFSYNSLFAERIYIKGKKNNFFEYEISFSESLDINITSNFTVNGIQRGFFR